MKICCNQLRKDYPVIIEYRLNRTITVGTTAFTRGYCGVHQHYPSFDIIDMGGRMYDPIVGRFLSPDPFVQDWENSQNFNRYSYCLNNPLKYTDPSGEFIWWPLISSTLFSAILGVSMSSLDGKSFWNGAWKGAISGAISASVGFGMDYLTKGFIAVGAIPGAFSRGIIDGLSGGISGGLSNMVIEGNFGHGFIEGSLSGFVTGAIKGGINGYRIASRLIGGEWEGNAITGRIGFDKNTVCLNYKNIGALQIDQTKHCYAYVLEYADNGFGNQKAETFVKMAKSSDGYDAITIAAQKGSGFSANRFDNSINLWESNLGKIHDRSTIVGVTSSSYKSLGSCYWCHIWDKG